MPALRRREIDFRSSEEVRRDIDRLCQGGYERAGQWDLGQVCGHLAITLEESITGYPDRWPWLMRRLVRWFALKSLFRTRKIRTGLKIPSRYVPPAAVDETAAKDQLRVAIAKVEQHAGEFAPHPFLDRLTPEQWRQLHLIHCAHHLSFLIPKEQPLTG
jgi:hypothetical protein